MEYYDLENRFQKAAISRLENRFGPYESIEDGYDSGSIIVNFKKMCGVEIFCNGKADLTVAYAPESDVEQQDTDDDDDDDL